MTEHEKLMTAVMSPDVKTAATTFVEELVSSTMLAVQQDPRAYGFVTLKDHDARVADLLEANNREVERRRAAESRCDLVERQIGAVILQRDIGQRHAAEQPPLHDRCGQCNTVAAAVAMCGQIGCPVMRARKAAA